MDDVTTIPSRSTLLLISVFSMKHLTKFFIPCMIATDGAVVCPMNWASPQESRMLSCTLFRLLFQDGILHSTCRRSEIDTASALESRKSRHWDWHTAHGLSPARQQLPTRPAERSASPAASRPPEVGPLAGATRRPLRGSATEWAPTPVLSARDTTPSHSQFCVPRDPGTPTPRTTLHTVRENGR